jgi:hypothetical protein
MNQRNDNKTIPAPNALAGLPLTAADLAHWGVNVVAYVKKVEIEGGTAYAIHAANGEPLGLAGTRDVAFAGLRQNDLEPASVH